MLWVLAKQSYVYENWKSDTPSLIRMLYVGWR